MVVFPGGGYSHLSDIKEGSDVAKWLNSLGISAFVLKYRFGMRYHQPNQFLDAARWSESFARRKGVEPGYQTDRNSRFLRRRASRVDARNALRRRQA